jgi:hypothetical protein
MNCLRGLYSSSVSTVTACSKHMPAGRCCYLRCQLQGHKPGPKTLPPQWKTADGVGYTQRSLSLCTCDYAAAATIDAGSPEDCRPKVTYAHQPCGSKPCSYAKGRPTHPPYSKQQSLRMPSSYAKPGGLAWPHGGGATGAGLVASNDTQPTEMSPWHHQGSAAGRSYICKDRAHMLPYVMTFDCQW